MEKIASDIHTTWQGRAVGLLDLDAFFASVEVLDHPEWRGLPLIVGGDADKRGVVSTCSYEARKFGVHSAMPSAQAKRLCPDAIWVQGRHKRYNVPGAGEADILLVPDYEVGNAMGKAMSIFGGAKNAGIIVGAKVPIVLVSRSDSAETKLASIAFGAVTAHHS